ncbi:MAG TPA: lipid-A-disaccharide synthase [Terracidiphilus sp.]|nr:lipid-A-disaccharide synthase [Terracidiphilus sp.]
MTPSIFISAGEASGEHYGAELARALSHIFAPKPKTAELWGMGGPQMEAAGVKIVVRAEDMAVMGLTEVVLHLPRIYREFRKLKRAIRANPPTVAILIDFPEINFRLAREFHRLGVPVIYFVSPQLWAWKQHRIELVRKYVRRMLVIFPFEESYYRDRGVAAEFVGHPLADLPQPSITREQFAAEYHLDPERTWIGLLPGSRMKEIESNLPEMLSAATLLGDKYEYILPLAPTLTASQRNAVQRIADDHRSNLEIRLIGDSGAEGAVSPTAGGALFHARASIVASGTATVEAALVGNPFVVVYRVSPLTYALAKRMVKVPHVAMANLIAQKRVVPELIQHDFTAANIVQHLEPLLPDGPARQSMTIELKAVRQALQAGSDNQPRLLAIERVAAIVVQEIEKTLDSAPPHSAEAP